MSLNDVLTTLQQRGIKLGLEGDQLKIRGAKEAMTPEIKQLLLENKAALLEWARNKTREQQDSQPIPPRAAELASLPLSFSQQRLWFLEQLDPGSAAYHIPAAALLTGKLDLAILNRVFAHLIERHESLRTTFATIDSDARQLVNASMPFVIDSENFAVDSISDAGRTAIMQRVMQEARTPFDLSKGPLLRVRLLRLNPASTDDTAQHLLLVTMHHIVTDGWSIKVMLGEMAQLYVAFSLQQPSPLPPLPIQYGDFACWQRATLTDEQLKTRLGYWQQKLAGVPVLELATDFTRPAVRRGIGTQFEFDIDGATLAALKSLAQQRGVTLFVVLLAAYYALLHRYTGQSDICIGTPIAGRTRAEVQNLIGFFVNTLALRSDVGGNPDIGELIARTNAVMLEASSNQDAPFESVVEALKLSRDMSTTPVFQTMLVLQGAADNKSAGRQALGNLSIEALESNSGTAKFDLTLNLHEAGNQLHVSIEYDTDLFSAARIERMGRHFTNTLLAFASNTGTRIGDIDYLDASERTQILTQWNNTATQYPKAISLGAQFEAVAAATPDAVAVSFDVDGVSSQHHQAQLSYGVLNAQAGRLANYLRQHGMQDNDNIAICVGRSPELIVGIVAIVKAGGAYVPLDPDYPDDRLAFMLADTKARLIITTSSHAQRLRQLDATALPPIVALDTDTAAIAGCSSDFYSAAENADGEKLAYIMYTSGSTGMPKGVMVPQRGITRLVKNTDYIALGADDVTGHISNVSFDAATLEIWGALLNGGRIAGIDKDTLLDREKFKRALINQRVSAMFITVTLFNLYIAEDPSMFASVKNLLVGGEALDPNKIRAALAANPPARLLNGYGPTENTTFTCVHHIEQLPANATTVPLGRPLANTTTYVLDQYGGLAAIGIAGELVTGGDGVALGYLNRDDLNAQKFVADPFAAKAQAKMYRTGDIVRWTADGRIEMLGRVDDQVKIRGFRIELGEIDAALGKLNDVRECAVVVRLDEHGNKLLAAYVVPQAGGDDSDTITRIRQQLSVVLPQFMLPHAYVLLEKLPLTSNGKLDRRALPEPDWSAQTSTQYVAPRDDIEQQLAQIWQEVLGVERIGINDSFFELGGHSLLATRAVARIEHDFKIQLPLRKLFEQPTIAAIAAVIAQAAASELPPLQVQDRSALNAIPLSFAQQRLWIIDQLAPGSPMYNIPFAARLRGNLDVAALERAINEIIVRHETLRTRFGVDANNDGAQIIEAATPWQLQVFAVDNDNTAIEQRAFAFLAAPFNLQQGPLFRAQLLRTISNQENDSQEYIFIACMHHIISDGWSMDVLLHEISVLYTAFSQNLPAALPPLPIQYADFSIWQQQVAATGFYEHQANYWLQQLKDTPALQLPTDFPRPVVLDARGRAVRFVIGSDVLAQLHGLAQQHNATLYMTLLAAFQLLLARYSGQTDIAVGSPVANRNHYLLEPLIGFFVNTVVLRSQFDLQQTFGELLAQVRQTTLDAYSHQDLPFEKLVDALNVPRDLSSTPLFQVLFVLQTINASSQLQNNARLGDVSFASLRDDADSFDTASKFDITLSLAEHDGTLHGTLEFRTSLWREDTMQAFCKHFATLLGEIAGKPQAGLRDYNFLTATEIERQLIGFNAARSLQERGSQLPVPTLLPIHTRVEQMVARFGDRTALSITTDNGTQSATYSALNKRANQIAHALIAQGVQPGDYVGLCLERSIELIAAMLGILKAGAAYVPLDAHFPAERLQYILEDSQARALIIESTLIDVLPNFDGSRIVVDADAALLAQQPDNNPGVSVTLDSTIYIIYTSGTTGKPKGCLLNHGNVARLFTATDDEFRFNEHDVWTLFHSFAFDFSVWEIWGALLFGGRLVIVPHAISRAPDEFFKLLVNEGVTVLNQTPSAFSQLVAIDAAQAQPANHKLRCVVFGGEALDFNALRPWVKRYGLAAPQLVNMYGITETTVHVTYYPLTQKDFDQGGSIVGKPIRDLHVHLLDAQGKLAPLGVPGEIYVSGPGVSDGYLKRPDLTAERFIDNPFAQQLPASIRANHQRLYKSGDLARYLPNGDIEYLGRIDLQVKIRGHRIELGEIESAIARIDGVREAVVIARSGADGNDLLIAYVVGACDIRTLRRELRKTLPDYMVPAACVTLDKMPLTTNGKADRKSLPAPDSSAFASAEFIAPTTASEQRLAEIWHDVLGIARVGIDDNFFELGGHSLNAVKMISRIRESFVIDISLAQAFEYPSVRELAQYIDSLQWASRTNPIEENATGNDREEFEL